MTAQYRKDYARARFAQVTVNSWTYDRLTETERKALKEVLFQYPLHGNSDHHLFEEYESRYSAFLAALGYNPIGWREPMAEAKARKLGWL